MSERYVNHKFIDVGMLIEFTELLKTNNISYIVEDSKGTFDVFFRNNEIDRDLIVKVKEEDSQKVRLIMKDKYKDLVAQVDPNHYLLNFSNDELLDIVSKPDEWGLFDYFLACDLLLKKGVVKDEESFHKLELKRVELIRNSYQDPSTMLTMGYILMFILPFFGIIIGHQLYNSKRTLPDGTIGSVYSPEARSAGKLIFFLSIILLLAYLGYMWISIFKDFY